MSAARCGDNPQAISFNGKTAVPAPSALPIGLEELVLVVHGFGRHRAVGLLEGLQSEDRERALILLDALRMLPARSRHAQLISAFELRQDAALRLLSCIEATRGHLRNAVLLALPHHVRTLLPPPFRPAPTQPVTEVRAFVQAWARRLAKEATR
jgi:hypothetical protein